MIPRRGSKVYVNLEVPEKNYTKRGGSMCVNDGFVIFRNSELLSGNLGKKILGGAKNGLFFRCLAILQLFCGKMMVGNLSTKNIATYQKHYETH